jgi:hypothetical protein
MKRVAAFAVLVLTALLTFAAQKTEQKDTTQANDFSGMYTFTKEGEFVQITLEDQGKVTGFVSRFGELQSDQGAFLDQFFKTASTDGTKLDFTTEQVHGVWFEFHGSVARGPGKTPNDEAYYVIQGKLTKYSTNAEKKTTAESREIEMKSFPQDVTSDQGKRD